MRPGPVDEALERGQDISAQSESASKLARNFLHRGNNQVVVGKENYFLSGDGLLMPAKKDQAPPDLRYFKQTSK
jgi:hypothetical protein